MKLGRLLLAMADIRIDSSDDLLMVYLGDGGPGVGVSCGFNMSPFPARAREIQIGNASFARWGKYRKPAGGAP